MSGEQETVPGGPSDINRGGGAVPKSGGGETGGETLGAALSTSTSSFEALDPHDPHLNHLAELTFSKTSQWINAELSSTQQDYKLLEQMNKMTATKYSDMEQITCNINKGITQLNDKYRELQPYLDQIDQIDESVTRLEEAAYKLDSYSKRLEAKFLSLEKRNN